MGIVVSFEDRSSQPPDLADATGDTNVLQARVGQPLRPQTDR
jgi:hypothetical protein